MTDVLLFGGTGEGRALAELLKRKRVRTLVCVASDYGEALLEADDFLAVHTGRLDADGIRALIASERPRRAIDATHPYAREVSANLRAACIESGTPFIRLRREQCAVEDCFVFGGMNELAAWLNTRSGAVFSMLGAKEAAALTAVSDYKERVFLRVLPSVESLTACLKAGFPAKHIICMQGPFSEEMNVAMLRAVNAKTIITKESGAAGGFPEKLAAAKKLGIALAVLGRAEDGGDCTLRELIQRIEGGAL